MLLKLNPVDKDDTSFPLSKKDSLYIRNNNTLVRVRLSEILWVQADGNYCEIHVADKKYLVKTSMKRLVTLLPEKHFVQIHKSYAVQLDQIEKLETKDNLVHLGAISLPMGRIYKENLLNRLAII